MRLSRQVPAALFTIAVFLLCLSPIRLDDLFLYLTFGRKLIGDGGFGPIDTLIFTIKDYHWELWHEWLAYLIYYGTHSLAGYEGLIVLRATLVAATSFIVWKACARAKLNPAATLALLSLALFVASPRLFRDRSSVFTDLFNLCLLFALSDSRLQQAQRKWFLPGLFLLWIQVHSGYLIGWFFVGLFYLSNWLRWNKKERLEWTIIFSGCVLITLVNPVFLHGVLWPVRAIFASDWGILGQITEFAPTMSADFLSDTYKIFFILLTAAGLLSAASSLKREGPFLFLVALTLAGLGFRYSRMAALTGFGMSLVIAASLARSRFELLRRESKLQSSLVCLLIVAACVYLSSTSERGLRFLFAGNPLHNSVPTEAVNFLKTLPPGNVFNEWVLGGYLAWELDGRQKIAAHGFVSDPKLVEHYIYRFSVSREGWNDIVLANDVRYFFLRRQTFEESRHAAWIKELEGPAWRAIYSDGAAILFTRAN